MLRQEIEALFDACLLTDAEMQQLDEFMLDQPNAVVVEVFPHPILPPSHPFPIPSPDQPFILFLRTNVADKPAAAAAAAPCRVYAAALFVCPAMTSTPEQACNTSPVPAVPLSRFSALLTMSAWIH